MKASKLGKDQQLMWESYTQKINESYANVDVVSADDAIDKNKEEILDNLDPIVRDMMSQGDWPWGSVEDFANDYEPDLAVQEIIYSTIDGTFDQDDIAQMSQTVGDSEMREALGSALIADMLSNPQDYANTLEVTNRVPEGNIEEDSRDLDPGMQGYEDTGEETYDDDDDPAFQGLEPSSKEQFEYWKKMVEVRLGAVKDVETFKQISNLITKSEQEYMRRAANYKN